MSGAKRISFVAVVGVTVGLLTTNGLAQSPVAQPTPGDEQTESAANEAGELSVLADRAVESPVRSRYLCRCIGQPESESVSKIRQALQSPLHSNGLDFTDQPLEEVVAFLQDDYGIAVQLDLPALKEMGVGPDEPVTVNLQNISLRSALRLMLEKLGLTSLVRDEVLMITSPEAAEMHLVTCVYDVTSLVDHKNSKSADALIDTIVSCVATQTWAENGGGEAEIRMLKPGLLVISQTQPIHDKVRDLLIELIEMQGRPAVTHEVEASSDSTDNEPLITRSYLLQLKGPEKSGNLGSDLRDLIVHSLPDERWTGRLDDGQAVVLSVLPDRIVVRHKESVHDALQELLMDSGVASLARPGASEGEGGGGGLFQIARPSKADRN